MKTISAVAALLALPLSALAIQITSPVTGTTWTTDGTHTVTWTFVDTDPSEFALLLVNNNVFPNFASTINAQVNTTLGTYSFDTSLPTGQDYQIEFLANQTPQNTGILALSGQFTIVQGAGTTSPITLASTTSSSTQTSTLVTSTTTGTSTSTATGSSSGSSSSGSGSGSSAGSTSTSTHLPTVSGTSAGVANYGSRGFAIAAGMIGIGFAAMFVVA